MNIREKLFYFSYIVTFFATFIPLTAFSVNISWKIFFIFKILACVILFFKIILDFDEPIKNIIYIIIITLILIISSFLLRNLNILIIWLFMLATKRININQFIKFNFFIVLFSLILVILFSKIGIIENYIYIRNVDGINIVRQSLGTIYPTVLGSIIFFLLLQYIYIKDKWKQSYALLFILIAIIIDKLTDNRLIVYLCIVMAIISIFRLDKFVVKWVKISNVIRVISISIPVIFVIICYNYKWDVYFYQLVNKVLSGRLYLSWLGFQNYEVSFFGQQVQMNGWGGNHQLAYGEAYFYLDSLPIYLLINFGILIFTVYIFFNFIFIKKILKSGSSVLMIILLLIILYDIVDNKSILLCLNPFPLILFNQYVYREGNSKGISHEINKELPL